MSLLLLALTACVEPAPEDSGTDSLTVPEDTSVTHIGDTDSATTPTDTDTGDPVEEAAYAALYDTAVVQDVYLSLSADALQALSADPGTYVAAGFRHGKVALKGEVGVRLKGDEGFDTKPSFRVKFNEFGGDRYATVERLSLDAMMEDPTQVHSVLAHTLWREAGLVGPRANFARVWVNDVYTGLYANVEVQDDHFADRHWADDPGGDFWEALDSADLTENGIQRFDLVSGVGDTQALANVDAILHDPDADFSEAAASVMDLDQYLAFWAWSLVLGCEDGYPYETDEFNLYREPSTGLYVWTNQALDDSFDTAIDWDRLRGDVGARCQRDEDCALALWDAVDGALATWSGWDVHARAEDLMLLTDQAVTDDPNKPWTSTEVDTARSRFLSRVDGLPDRVRGWIGDRPATDSGATTP